MTTNFLQFDPNQTNIMSQSDYNLSSQRTDGVVPGLALSAMHNKLFFQLSTMMVGIGNVLSDAGQNIADTDLAGLQDAIEAVFITPQATTSLAGKSEFATTAEMVTGTDVARSLVVDQWNSWVTGYSLKKIVDSANTGQASATFGNIFNATNNLYLIRIYMEPATDGAIPWLRVTTGGGTPVSSGTPYAYGANNLTGSSSPGVGAGTNSSAANQIVFQRNGVGNATSEAYECYLLIGSPANTSRWTRTWSIGAATQTDGSINVEVHAGVYLSTTAVDGFQILFSTGNMDVHEVQVYQFGEV